MEEMPNNEAYNDGKPIAHKMDNASISTAQNTFGGTPCLRPSLAWTLDAPRFGMIHDNHSRPHQNPLFHVLWAVAQTHPALRTPLPRGAKAGIPLLRRGPQSGGVRKAGGGWKVGQRIFEHPNGLSPASDLAHLSPSSAPECRVSGLEPPM